jgi:Domain of unknown function (DUF4148)
MFAKTLVSLVITLASAAAFSTAALAAGGEATPDHPMVVESTLTRAQVVAETLEAIRVGAISRRERTTSPTAAQLESIHVAGQRAADLLLAMR